MSQPLGDALLRANCRAKSCAMCGRAHTSVQSTLLSERQLIKHCSLGLCLCRGDAAGEVVREPLVVQLENLSLWHNALLMKLRGFKSRFRWVQLYSLQGLEKVLPVGPNVFLAVSEAAETVFLYACLYQHQQVSDTALQSCCVHEPGVQFEQEPETWCQSVHSGHHFLESQAQFVHLAVDLDLWIPDYHFTMWQSQVQAFPVWTSGTMLYSAEGASNMA